MNRLRASIGGSVLLATSAYGQASLPPPDPPFTGTLERTLAGSHADVPAPVRPPEGAPNVVIVLIDDAGFGNPATFGGPVTTPTLDRLAQEGLRYNRFHVTALCSPTRAALLSGRNHHSVGFGMVTEVHSGYPGYDARWPRSAAPLATILRDNGYGTAAIGKWHLTPDDQQGPAGPFDRWPNQLGFQYFWGFLGGEDSHYDSMLVENNSILGVPKEKGFYLTTAMADRAIAWLRGQKSQAPEQPFFLYFATGASHAPHQVPKEWADKYKGKFDAGWDALRQATFARQKQLGVIPQDAVLTPRPGAFPDWRLLALSDVASFHHYLGLPHLRDVAAELRKEGRPLLCTEWLARGLGSVPATHLPFFREERIGCFHWGLVNGRTQTHLPWPLFAKLGEGGLWHHDLFHPGGRPYDAGEIALFRAHLARPAAGPS